jgi:hypothetical protein
MRFVLLLALATVAEAEPVPLEGAVLAAICGPGKRDEDQTYRATVDPTSVRFGAYDSKRKRLPIQVDRSLIASGGALVLSVMDRRGSYFTLEDAEARALTGRAEQKQLRLAIVFELDDAGSDAVPPCFTYPKSETYSVRIAPISYALLDAEGRALAEARTDRGIDGADKGVVQISTRVVGGVVDEVALFEAVDARRAEMSACFQALIAGGQSGVVGYAAVADGEKLREVRPEMEAIDDPAATECVAKVLAAASLRKPSRAGRVAIVVRVD